MEKRSRRDFLRLAAAVPFVPFRSLADIPPTRPYPEPEASRISGFVDSELENNYPIILQREKERNPVGTVEFQEIGPFYSDGKVERVPNDGTRSLWVRPENPDVIYAGEWGHVGNGLEKSIDGGKTWQTVINKRHYIFYGGVPRDFFQYEDQVFLVTDYKLLRERSDGKWDTNSINLPVLQTGAALKDGTLLVGGMGGIQVISDFEFEEDKKRSSFRPASEKAQGLPEDIFVRSIEVDERTGRIYVGGWMDYSGIGGQTTDKGGSGLWVSDDNGKTFKEHEHAESLINNKGQNPTINSINVTYYKGHQIIIIGGEGRGPLTDRKPSPDVPSLWVSVNGGPFSEQIAGFMDWAEENGNDLVNPQRGITETENYLIISSYANSIVACRKDDIIYAQYRGEPITWHRISPEGFVSGATAVVQAEDGTDTLFSGGHSWRSTKPAFTPISKATNIEGQLDKIFKPQ